MILLTQFLICLIIRNCNTTVSIIFSYKPFRPINIKTHCFNPFFSLVISTPFSFPKSFRSLTTHSSFFVWDVFLTRLCLVFYDKCLVGGSNVRRKIVKFYFYLILALSINVMITAWACTLWAVIHFCCPDSSSHSSLEKNLLGFPKGALFAKSEWLDKEREKTLW